MSTIINLPNLVRDKFNIARVNGDLNFYETQVSILQCEGVPFQVRFSPALASKPKSSKPRDLNTSPIDPFSNPDPGLLVSSSLDSHFIVLNKFPVIPNHFILATKEYKLQTHLLEEDDIGAAYQCLAAFRENGEDLFGFFNSGDHSGASQPHRHIQFLPLESMRTGMDETKSWGLLADTLALENPLMPFTYFASDIDAALTARQLHEIYLNLHGKACRAAEKLTADTSRNLESPISYNLGLTNRTMVICPRTCEGIDIKANDGEPIGPVSLNGTILGGTLLVKSEAEWNLLRGDEAKLKNVLSSIGINPSDNTNVGRI